RDRRQPRLRAGGDESLHGRIAGARARAEPAAVVDARAQQHRNLLCEAQRLRARARLLELLAGDRRAAAAGARLGGCGAFAPVGLVTQRWWVPLPSAAPRPLGAAVATS